jgi:hypothetical protein
MHDVPFVVDTNMDRELARERLTGGALLSPSVSEHLLPSNLFGPDEDVRTSPYIDRLLEGSTDHLPPLHVGRVLFELDPEVRQKLALAGANALEKVAELLHTGKVWVGNHNAEVYNPWLKAFTTIVNGSFILLGGLIGGILLTNLFPKPFSLRQGKSKKRKPKMKPLDG